MCRSTARDLVEMARGAVLDDVRTAVLTRHLRECAECSGRLDRERALSADMKRLAEDTSVPALSPEREAAMLAAFDTASERPGGSSTRRIGVAAAFAAVAATLAWAVNATRTSPLPSAATPGSIVVPGPVAAQVDRRAALGARLPSPVRPRLHRRTLPSHAPDPASFVVVPGAADLPTFESGHLLRMQMPASVAVSIGLSPPSRSAIVQADVLVGQDGYARAVRLVP